MRINKDKGRCQRKGYKNATDKVTKNSTPFECQHRSHNSPSSPPFRSRNSVIIPWYIHLKPAECTPKSNQTPSEIGAMVRRLYWAATVHGTFFMRKIRRLTKRVTRRIVVPGRIRARAFLWSPAVRSRDDVAPIYQLLPGMLCKPRQNQA